MAGSLRERGALAGFGVVAHERHFLTPTAITAGSAVKPRSVVPDPAAIVHQRIHKSKLRSRDMLGAATGRSLCFTHSKIDAI